MPDEKLLDNTEETIGDLLYRVEDILTGLVETVRPLPAHIDNLVSDVAHLKLISAAKEVPAAVINEGGKAGEVVKSGVDAGGSAVALAPAAATDVLEDVEPAVATVKRGGGSIFSQKIKRRS